MRYGPIKLRPIEKRDAAMLIEFLNDPSIATMVVDYGFPVSSVAQEEWFQTKFPGELACRFMIEAEDKTVGTIIFSQIDCENKTGEVGYKIAKAFQGKNYAACALYAMQCYLFDVKGIECIVAYHFQNNIGSRRVLEKTGFSYEGTRRKCVYRNGQRLDLLYWSCERKRFESIRKDFVQV